MILWGLQGIEIGTKPLSPTGLSPPSTVPVPTATVAAAPAAAVAVAVAAAVGKGKPTGRAAVPAAVLAASVYAPPGSGSDIDDDIVLSGEGDKDAEDGVYYGAEYDLEYGMPELVRDVRALLSVICSVLETTQTVSSYVKCLRHNNYHSSWMIASFHCVNTHVISVLPAMFIPQ